MNIIDNLFFLGQGAGIVISFCNKTFLFNTIYELAYTLANSPTGQKIYRSYKTGKLSKIRYFSVPTALFVALSESRRCYKLATDITQHDLVRIFAAIQGILCSLTVVTRVGSKFVKNPVLRQKLIFLNWVVATSYTMTCGDGRFILSQRLTSITESLIKQTLAEQIESGMYSNTSFTMAIIRYMVASGWDIGLAMMFDKIGAKPAKLTPEVGDEIMRPPLPALLPLVPLSDFFELHKIIYLPEALIKAEQYKEYWRLVVLSGVFDPLTPIIEKIKQKDFI